MNWGTKLVLGMVTFMTFIITLVVLMMRSGSDDLVDQDYYQKGIEYDKDYVRKNRVIEDKAEPEISSGESLKINFKRPTKGTIRFLHPSVQNKDKVIPMESGNENSLEIPLKNFPSGHWKILLEWESSGKEYMFQKSIIIQ